MTLGAQQSQNRVTCQPELVLPFQPNEHHQWQSKLLQTASTTPLASLQHAICFDSN